jgi:DNA-binding FadR family transcriptional regulator
VLLPSRPPTFGGRLGIPARSDPHRGVEPGQRVTQAELATKLGVSTMPVGEALLRLIAEGLVEAATARSFRVTYTTHRTSMGSPE